jgi:hypothetical protein
MIALRYAISQPLIGGIRQTTQRPAALAILAAALLTVIVFPTGWQGLLRGSAVFTGILAARDALLVAAAAASCWRVLRAARSGENRGRLAGDVAAGSQAAARSGLAGPVAWRYDLDGGRGR